MTIEEIVERNTREKRYHSPLFNKTTLELSDLKNSPTRRSSFSVERPILPPRISSRVIEKNTFNDNLIRFSKMSGGPRLDSFLQTYDRIVNSIRIGLGNKNIIPKKKRIIVNRKFMHDLATNRISRDISLNVNPCITMKPIVNILLKSVEVVINEKTKSLNNPQLIENDKKSEDKDNVLSDKILSDSPKQTPMSFDIKTEDNIQSEEATESTTAPIHKFDDKYYSLDHDDKEKILLKITDSSDIGNNKNWENQIRENSKKSNNSNNLCTLTASNTIDSLKSYRTLKGEGKVYKDILLESDSFKQLYESISRDIHLIESITKSEKEAVDPLSYSQNDPSETLFITNQNIGINDFDREHIKIDDHGNNINGILYRKNSMSKSLKDSTNTNDLSSDTTAIDKIPVDKTLINDNPLNNNTKNNEEILLSSQSNLPVKLLNRSSSLGSKKDLENKYRPSKLENKNSITEMMDKYKRHSSGHLNINPISNNYPSQLNASNDNPTTESNTEINSNVHTESDTKINQSTNSHPNVTNNTNTNTNTNINSNTNSNTNTNTPSNLDQSNITNGITNGNQSLNKLPMIPRRRSSITRKYKSTPVPPRIINNNNNNNNTIINNNNNKINNNKNNNNNNNNNNDNNKTTQNEDTAMDTSTSTEDSTIYEFPSKFNYFSDKRYSIDTADLNRNSHKFHNKNELSVKDVSVSLTTPKRSPNASLRNKSPNLISSPNVSHISTSFESIEVPAMPEAMEKRKNKKMSKTLSYIKILSPKSSSHYGNERMSKSEVDLPSRILFDDDENNTSQYNDNSSSYSKSKRFSLSKLKNKVIKKTSRDSYKNNKDVSILSDRLDNSILKHSYRHSMSSFNLNDMSSLNSSIHHSEADIDVNRSHNNITSPLIKSNNIDYQPVVRKNSHPLIQRTDIPTSPSSVGTKETNDKSIIIPPTVNNNNNNNNITESKKEEIIEESKEAKEAIEKSEKVVENQENKTEIIIENVDDDDDDEWIDEIDYNQDNQSSFVMSKNSSASLKKKNLKNGKGKSNTLKKGHSRHGSVRYRRPTNKYTVIKPRNTKISNSNSISNLNTNSNPVNTIPASLESTNPSHSQLLNPNTSYNSQHQISNQNDISKEDPNISINSNYLNPNQSILSKGDITLSAISVNSRTSSVKLKKNIMKKIFHINIKKRQDHKHNVYTKKN